MTASPRPDDEADDDEIARAFAAGLAQVSDRARRAEADRDRLLADLEQARAALADAGNRHRLMRSKLSTLHAWTEGPRSNPKVMADDVVAILTADAASSPVPDSTKEER